MPYYTDTHPEIERVQFELMRQVPIGKKLLMVANLNQAAIEMAMSGLRAQYPGENPTRLRRRLADRLLGKELAEKVYGPILPEEDFHAA